MGRKAGIDDTVDPVRQRLAAAASAPVERKPQRAPKAAPEQDKEPVTERPKPARRASGQKTSNRLTVNRKFLFTEQEAEQMLATTNAVSAAFGSKVTQSQIARSLFAILSGAEDGLSAGGGRRMRNHLAVPSKGDHEAMADYEAALADFLEAALKRS